MSIKENIEVLKSKEEKYQNNKVSKLSYSDTAYTEDLVEGNPDFSESAEQNIPLGTAENLHLPKVMLDKGQRAQASFLFRSMLNHFLGRASYNLNKAHDYFLALLQSLISYIAEPNGVATLDNTGRIPVTQVPEDSINLLGTWDAETNTPTLQDGEGINGDLYLVSVEGEQDLGSGLQYFFVNDKVVYQNGIWNRIPVGELISLNGNFDDNGDIEIKGTQIALSSDNSKTLPTVISEKAYLSSTIQNKSLEESQVIHANEIYKTSDSATGTVKDLLDTLANDVSINNKSLSSDVFLTGEDIKDSDTSVTDKLNSLANSSIKINNRQLTSDVILTGADIPLTNAGIKIVQALENVSKIKEYTYIVDSQSALSYWLSNKTTGNSSGGSDFTSVLIKKGNWIYEKIPNDLDVLGTVSIDAEAGAKLTCPVLRYNELSFNTQKHIRGLEIEGALENACNINKCIATETIKNCLSVQNCTGVFENSYSQPVALSLYDCATYPEKGFNIAL